MIEILKFLGGSTILLAAVAWLIRSLVTHALDKEAETHKETMKAQIARGSRLQEERGTVIKDIYANLVELVDRTHSFVHPAEWLGEPTKEEKQKLVAESLLKFRDHFEKNKIFLSPDLCKRIQEFVDSFIKPAAKFATYHRMAKNDNVGNIAKDFHEAWFSAFEKMEQDLPSAREALEDEFRSVIGIKNIDENS